MRVKFKKMGVYYRVYNITRKEKADITYPQNGGLEWVRNFNFWSLKEMTDLFYYVVDECQWDKGDVLLAYPDSYDDLVSFIKQTDSSTIQLHPPTLESLDKLELRDTEIYEDLYRMFREDEDYSTVDEDSE